MAVKKLNKKVTKKTTKKKTTKKGAEVIGIFPPGKTPERVMVETSGFAKTFESDEDWFNNWPQSDSPEWHMIKAEDAYADAYKTYIIARRILALRRKQLHEKYIENKLQIATYTDHG